MHHLAEASDLYHMQTLLQLLTRPWTMDILSVLESDGPTRFGALRRKIRGISARVLRERLRVLEEKKIVFRQYEPTMPPAVTYGVTPRIREVEGALGALEQIVRRWLEEDLAIQSPAPNHL